MPDVGLFAKRISLPGWVLLGLSGLSFAANLQGSLELLERITSLQLPPLAPWVPWLLALLGLLYFSRLWHAETTNEPLRQIFRLSALPAIGHREQLSRAIGELLARKGPTGRLAQVALEDASREVDRFRSQATKVMEKPTLGSRLRTAPNQRVFVALLNAYEPALYRLRDAGIAADFEWATHPNFPHWKRHDTELLQGVRHLIHQSRYSHLGQALENSGMWKDGVRTYL